MEKEKIRKNEQKRVEEIKKKGWRNKEKGLKTGTKKGLSKWTKKGLKI